MIGNCSYFGTIWDTTSQVTCCCFGREDLDILFITSACIGLKNNQEVHTGGLYAVKVRLGEDLKLVDFFRGEGGQLPLIHLSHWPFNLLFLEQGVCILNNI